jgi:hypothetical protein
MTAMIVVVILFAIRFQLTPKSDQYSESNRSGVHDDQYDTFALPAVPPTPTSNKTFDTFNYRLSDSQHAFKKNLGREEGETFAFKKDEGETFAFNKNRGDSMVMQHRHQGDEGETFSFNKNRVGGEKRESLDHRAGMVMQQSHPDRRYDDSDDSSGSSNSSSNSSC